MRKAFLHLVTSIIVISIVFAFNISAFATEKQWEPRAEAQDTETYVNGEISYDFSWTQNVEAEGITVEYYGEGTVCDWEFPLSKEGEDYEVLSRQGNTIVIKIINENKIIPYMNAIVISNDDEKDENENSNIEVSSIVNSSEKATARQETTEKSQETTYDNSMSQTNESNKAYIGWGVGAIFSASLIVFVLLKKKSAK